MNLIGIFTTVIIVKNLSTNDYGTYGLILSIIISLKTFSSLGLSSVITRNIARNNCQSTKDYSNSFVLSFFVSLLISCIIYFVMIFNIIDISITVFLVMCGLLFVQTFTQNFQDVFFGLKRMEPVAFLNLLFSISMLTLILVIPSLYFTLENVLFILFFSSLFRLMGMAFISFYYDFLNFSILKSSFTIKYSKQLLILAFPFYITALLSLVSNQFPIQFLAINSTNDEIAFFNASNKLIAPFFLLVSTAMTALFPNMSVYFKEKPDLFRIYAKKGFKIILIFGSLFAFFIGLFSNEIIDIFFDNRYNPSKIILVYLSWNLILFSIFNFIGSLLGASDNQKTLSILSFFYALVNSIILWIFSKYGAISLSIGFVISAIINLTYHWIIMSKKLKIIFTLNEKFKLILFPTILILFSIILFSQNLVLKTICFLVILFSSIPIIINFLKFRFNGSS